MEAIYAAANAASRSFAGHWRRGNILRCHRMLTKHRLRPRLVNFYLDEIEQETRIVLDWENQNAA